MKSISNNKEQELNKLTMHYFWKQKVFELLIILGVILWFFIISPLIVAQFTDENTYCRFSPPSISRSTTVQEDREACLASGLKTGYWTLFFIGLLGDFVLMALGLFIFYFIDNNLKRARIKAKRELGIELNYDESYL